MTEGQVFGDPSQPVNDDGAEVVHIGIGRPAHQQIPEGFEETLFKISLEAYFLDSTTRRIIDEYLITLEKEFGKQFRQ